MSTDVTLPSDRAAAERAQYVTQTTAIEQARAVAEVQAAVMVAQQMPRDMGRAWAEMRAACGRLALAQRAFYAVPNRGSGPSVHLARELARIWGNLDYGVRELRRDDERHESEIQASAWDQQTNVRSSRTFQVPHARMNKKAGGGRQILVDLGDIYANNQNQGARAVRECIFSVLPADFVGEAQDLCRATIQKGDGKPLDQRITEMVRAYQGIGVTVVQLEVKAGRKRREWTAAEVAELGVVFTSIHRNETTAAEEFPVAPVTADEVAHTTPTPAADEPPADLWHDGADS